MQNARRGGNRRGEGRGGEREEGRGGERGGRGGKRGGEREEGRHCIFTSVEIGMYVAVLRTHAHTGHSYCC